MLRRLSSLAAVCVTLFATGCTTDGTGSHRSMFNENGEFSFKRAVGWEEVKMPRNLKVPPTDLKLAERVDTLGRRIIAQNTFTGIDPLFHTVGIPESLLFHRGSEELFISEGLVRRCKSEAELAAVLCAELGQMVSEKKAARRVGAERDSFPEVGLAGGTATMTSGGTAEDAGRAAERAYQERRQARTSPPTEPIDATKQARELLKGAGYEPGELDRVEPLLKQSDRGTALKKQMSGPAPAPKWDN